MSQRGYMGWGVLGWWEGGFLIPSGVSWVSGISWGRGLGAVYDWSSQLCFGVPGLEGLLGLGAVGGWFLTLAGVSWVGGFARDGVSWGGGKVGFVALVGASWGGVIAGSASWLVSSELGWQVCGACFTAEEADVCLECSEMEGFTWVLSVCGDLQ